ncbi:DUF1501 domain-containing protein [Aurantiacibacter aquimixticola]|nr:DUF1501 domain-containing protein [Aurantiacibacter aquimixticola]
MMKLSEFPGASSRRDFLRGAGSLPLTGVLLASGAQAQSAQNTDYRALVCIYLQGGWDNWSIFVPFDEASHAAYGEARGAMALSQSELGSGVLQPRNDMEGRSFALHPQMTGLRDAFRNGDLAIVQNVGTLWQPVSKQGIRDGALIPSQLFSHNHQSRLALAGYSDKANTGWGGRIADRMRGRNARQTLTSLNATTHAQFLSGADTSPYAITEKGAVQLLDGDTSFFGTDIAQLVESVATGSHDNPMRDTLSDVTRRTLDHAGLLGSSFARIDGSELPELQIGSSDLAEQLRAIARAIAVGPSLGMRRQVFFARMHGWDTHSGGLGDVRIQASEIDRALSGFHRLLQRWGLSSAVTTASVSDFGRTLASNGDGSDHGWGGTSFVLGGAVAGGRIYGKSPTVALDGPDTLSGGRLIPTTSTDQIAASLARWMGVADTDLASIANNIGHFPADQRALPIFR